MPSYFEHVHERDAAGFIAIPIGELTRDHLDPKLFTPKPRPILEPTPPPPPFLDENIFSLEPIVVSKRHGIIRPLIMIGLITILATLGTTLVLTETDKLWEYVELAQEYSLASIAYAGEHSGTMSVRFAPTEQVNNLTSTEPEINPSLTETPAMSLPQKHAAETPAPSKTKEISVDEDSSTKPLTCRNWNPEKDVEGLYLDEVTFKPVLRCGNQLYLPMRSVNNDENDDEQQVIKITPYKGL